MIHTIWVRHNDIQPVFSMPVDELNQRAYTTNEDRMFRLHFHVDGGDDDDDDDDDDVDGDDCGDRDDHDDHDDVDDDDCDGRMQDIENTLGKDEKNVRNDERDSMDRNIHRADDE